MLRISGGACCCLGCDSHVTANQRATNVHVPYGEPVYLELICCAPKRAVAKI